MTQINHPIRDDYVLVKKPLYGILSFFLFDRNWVIKSNSPSEKERSFGRPNEEEKRGNVSLKILSKTLSKPLGFHLPNLAYFG